MLGQGNLFVAELRHDEPGDVHESACVARGAVVLREDGGQTSRHKVTFENSSYVCIWNSIFESKVT